MKFAQILLPININMAFDYEIPEGMHLDMGDFVTVPFRGKEITGIVWGLSIETDFHSRIKTILHSFPGLKLSKIHMDFIQWSAHYTITPLGLVLKMMIGAWTGRAKDTFRKELDLIPPNLQAHIKLNPAQEEAYKQIAQALTPPRFQPFLLDGVTGSGKTQVFLKAMQKAIMQASQEQARSNELSDDMGQVLILVPEIALTNQLLERCEKIFENEPFSWHSHLNPRIRLQTWQAIQNGTAKIIIGTRSALYLPFHNLKMIIIDEEHDATFKQEDGVLYNARDMAVVNAKLWNIPILLVSATPSLETWANVLAGKYKHLILLERYQEARLPHIKVIDLRMEKLKSQQWLSAPLRNVLQETLDRKEQSILFLNRRGYSPLILCRTCGYHFMCPSCSTWLVSHQKINKISCHHCGWEKEIPKECPECKNTESLAFCGPGVERVYEEVQTLFPQARLGLLTSDECTTPNKIHLALKAIEKHEVDIIIGTQMIAKGHHFEKITLVGIVDGDLGLSGADLRASERTYQLLHQVSGRAGRADLAGQVLLQTYNPYHPLMEALKNQDRDSFLSLELEQRQLFQMPPYGKLIGIIISGLQEDQVRRTSEDLGRALKSYLAGSAEVLGPVQAVLSKVRGRYRWRILLKSSKILSTNTHLHQFFANFPAPGSVRITIDVDPYNFM